MIIKVQSDKILKLLQSKEYDTLQQYIIQELKYAEKSPSDRARYKAFASLAKKFTKSMDTRPQLSGAFVDDGKLVLCDGYRIYAMVDTSFVCEMIKVEPNDAILKILTSIDLTKGIEIEFEYDRFKAEYALYKAKKANKETMEKSETFFTIDYGKYSNSYNLDYLYDTDKIIGLKECEFVSVGENSPLHFENKQGDRAILLPVRPLKNSK